MRRSGISVAIAGEKLKVTLVAKGRFLSKSVSTSQKLASLSTDSPRLLWTWLLPHLDREGRFHADPAIVKGHAVPRLKNHTEKAIEANLQELASVGLIVLYQVNGDRYLQFNQFDENQPGLRKEREAESQCPAPPDKVRSKSGAVPELGGEVASQALKYKLKLKLNISYDSGSRRWSGIASEDMEAWAKAYPACDINLELAKAGEWIIANPAKGKKSNYRRFIVNWLSRSQDRGGSMPSNKLEHRVSQIGASGDVEAGIARAVERNRKAFPELREKGEK